MDVTRGMTAAITGASSGIGRALAEHLAGPRHTDAGVTGRPVRNHLDGTGQHLEGAVADVAFTVDHLAVGKCLFQLGHGVCLNLSLSNRHACRPTVSRMGDSTTNWQIFG